MFLPSDEMDPSVMSFPMKRQKMIFIMKNRTSPNNSTDLMFIRQNETMKTNIKKKYLMNDFISDVAIPYLQFIY